LAKDLNQKIRRSREQAGGFRGVMKGNSLSVRVAVFLIMSASFLLFLSVTDKRQPVKPILQVDTTGRSEGFVSDSAAPRDSI
jgi:hypothetical protein